MRLLFALTLAFVALPTAVAAAEKFPTVDDAVQIAYKAWPSSPCNGQLTVTEEPWLDASDYDGWTANDGSCDVDIAPYLNSDPAHRCDIIVHEAGHRAGLGHSETGVMAPVPWPYAPCHDQRPLVVQRIQRLLPGTSWRVSCRGPLVKMSCRATRRGARARRYSARVFGVEDFYIDRVDTPRWNLH